jgi:hypothetical protein
LDVTSNNKGFLPPRVTLTSATDNTTIPSPAEGLFVYNKGSVGLQAGYYYWNGANWATIATATSAGNGVTATNMVNLYSQAYSTAANTLYSGYSFTVPVSGRYLFDFSCTGFSNATITFKVRQGTTDLATDAQTSYNNTVHVEYNGKIEVNLQSGTTYNVYVTTTGNRDAGDYDRVYYKMVAGNLPVTGQTVDYVSTSLSSQYASVGNGYDIVLQQLNGGNIPYNTSTGVYTLSANKTYMMQAQLRVNTASTSSAYLQYAWVDATTNNVLVTNSDALTSSQSNSAGYGSKEVTQIIYTPSTNQTIKLRSIGTLGTQTITQGTAVIMQIGSSAIVNPWVLSGNDVYNTTGKVGIGTNAPASTLDVSGSLAVSGATNLKNTLNVGTGVGYEGGEIDLVTAASGNTSLTNGTVAVDVYGDKLRIFENGGNARGVYVDLGKAPNNVDGELTYKKSFANLPLNTALSIDNISVQIKSQNGGVWMFVNALTGSPVWAFSLTYQIGNGVNTYAQGLTSIWTASNTPTTLGNANYAFSGSGSVLTVIITDTNANKMYRVTWMTTSNTSPYGNFVAIERVV